MTIELTPKGTHGAGMPKAPRPLMKVIGGLMVWFARHMGNRFVVLNTIGARTGLPHTVALGRFPDGEGAFLVRRAVASSQNANDD